MKRITFITGNSGKYNEAKSIVGEHIELEQVDIDLPEIQTVSVKEVIENKLKEGYKQIKTPLIVEDTGLEFEAWDGLPGALIKFFLKSVGNEGLIKMLDQYKNKRAKIVCYVGYFDGEHTVFFKGELSGSISDKVLGESGFHFDKIFIPAGESRTFAQMSSDEKKAISHRKIAFEKLKDHLLSEISLV